MHSDASLDGTDVTAAASDPVRQAFAAAASWFAALVAAIPADAWDLPGLGVWDVRALTGHGSRSLITVDTYLDQPAEAVEIAAAWQYYLATSTVTITPEAVAERGRAAGANLGADPARFIRELVARVVPRIQTDLDPVITTIVGGMRLSDYLPTRTFELVVHGYDLAAAVGIDPPQLQPEVLAGVIQLAGQIATARGDGPELLMALTGRRPLPSGFSVV